MVRFMPQPRDPATDPAPAATASFGFQEVDPTAKPGLVRGVFDSVAGRYDLMNDLMSGGVHRLWKRSMIDWLHQRPGQHLIDVAGGTGDIAFRFLDWSQRRGNAEDGARVCVVDLTPALLEVGRDRALYRCQSGRGHGRNPDTTA